MRWILSLACVVVVAVPATALYAVSRAPTAAARPLAPARTGPYDRLWLALSATDGIRVSFDDGRRWALPGGLPLRGSFYTMIVDPAQRGTACATNGDVFCTTNGGANWTRLPSAPDAGPAGITALAYATDGTLYAAGVRVLTYARHRWQEWGQGWDAPAAPAILLPGPGLQLYAAVDSHLYVADGPDARWRSLPTRTLNGAPITAMALGPDESTPYLAVRGEGIWYLDRGQALRRLAGFPAGASVYALRGDPDGPDLYVASSAGLYAQDQNDTSEGRQNNPWRQVVAAAGDPIVALLAVRREMLGVTADGVVYHGARGRWQALSWHAARQRIPVAGGQLADALVGAAWQQPPPSTVPARFKTDCLFAGPALGQSFDVCGPFRDYYVRFSNRVFGWPLERAELTPTGVVRQAFENVTLEWTSQSGVSLAPLGQLAARGRHFPRPTPQQVRENGNTTAYIDGYFVDPLFYGYWREHNIDGVSIFGPPISQKMYLPSTDGSGRDVWVQYFVNARLEYHPEALPGQQIRLSSLGHR